MAAERPAFFALGWRFLVVAAGLVLLWRAIHMNVVVYGEDGRPRLGPAASVLRGGDDERQVLRGILDANPAEVAALLMVAREHERRSERELAARAYRAALEIAPYERDVLALAADFFLRAGDALAIELLGRLAGHYPETRDTVFATLASLLSSEPQRQAVAEHLTRKPTWLGAFALDACRRGLDPRLLAAWLPRATGPTDAPAAETACAIDRLRAAGRWEEAHQLWLNSLPPARLARVGHVFNGGFEQVPTGAGFDWLLQPRPEREAGHMAEVIRVLGAEGERSLRVSYNGKRQHGVPARQYTLLAPGEYELSGMARHEGLKALRGVHWTLRCVEQSQPGKIIASSERFLGSSEWRRFATAISIPAGCAGQVLQLEPVAEPGAPAFVAGHAWFDDIRLRRR